MSENIDEKPETAEFAPGTFGCHEALHMASFFADAVYEHLADHPAIKSDPEFRALADNAVQAIADLYQAIGSKHMQSTPL